MQTARRKSGSAPNASSLSTWKTTTSTAVPLPHGTPWPTSRHHRKTSRPLQRGMLPTLPLIPSLRQHQEKNFASGRTGCVRTHQALGTLWTHPGRVYTAPNTKRSGNVNSDTACHGTVHSDSVWTQLAIASAYRTERVRAFSFWTQPCQGIFLLDAAVSEHFPSGRSHVRAFSFWTQPCQSIFLLGTAVSGQMASRPCVSWHHGHAVCQGTEYRSKYSCHIRKHAVGSRHSDSVQFYSFYLMYIYICYYHTSRGNKGKLANTIRCDEHDAMSTTTMSTTTMRKMAISTLPAVRTIASRTRRV